MNRKHSSFLSSDNEDELDAFCKLEEALQSDSEDEKGFDPDDLRAELKHKFPDLFSDKTTKSDPKPSPKVSPKVAPKEAAPVDEDEYDQMLELSKQLQKSYEVVKQKKLELEREQKRFQKERRAFAKERAKFESEQIFANTKPVDTKLREKYDKLKEKYDTKRKEWACEKTLLVGQIEDLRRALRAKEAEQVARVVQQSNHTSSVVEIDTNSDSSGIEIKKPEQSLKRKKSPVESDSSDLDVKKAEPPVTRKKGVGEATTSESKKVEAVRKWKSPVESDSSDVEIKELEPVMKWKETPVESEPSDVEVRKPKVGIEWKKDLGDSGSDDAIVIEEQPKPVSNHDSDGNDVFSDVEFVQEERPPAVVRATFEKPRAPRQESDSGDDFFEESKQATQFAKAAVKRISEAPRVPTTKQGSNSPVRQATELQGRSPSRIAAKGSTKRDIPGYVSVASPKKFEYPKIKRNVVRTHDSFEIIDDGAANVTVIRANIGSPSKPSPSPRRAEKEASPPKRVTQVTTPKKQDVSRLSPKLSERKKQQSPMSPSRSPPVRETAVPVRLHDDYDIDFDFNPGSVVREIPGANGKKTLKYRDGSSATVFSNGTRKMTRNGCTYVFYTNGDVSQEFSDKAIAYRYAATRTIELTLPDRSVLYSFENGQREKHFPNGDKAIQYTNGTFRINYANGDYQINHPDGRIERCTNGKIEILDE